MSPWSHIAKWCETETYLRVQRRRELSSALERCMNGGGFHLIEVVYNPVYDHRLHQEYWAGKSHTHAEELGHAE